MKKMIVVMGIILISSPLFAGQKEGNGGGVWACGYEFNYKFEWIEFVDLYEGREEFHLNIPQRSSQDYHEILKEIEGRLSSMNEKFGETISRYIADIISSMIFTNAKLTIIDDALYRIQPLEASCQKGTVTYQQLANFTHYGKTLIQKTIWDDEKFSELGRAALIVHEALYKYARETKKDTNSVRTREAVAHIFSDMDKDSLRERLSNHGWFDSEPIDPPTDPEKRRTTTGAIFTRDRSNEKLNEAWRDPAGLIWGDKLKEKSVNQTGAIDYCNSIGARLPSKDEFTRLREYMGARSGTYEGYSAQVLPNLSGNWFWSSSFRGDSWDLYIFHGSYGRFSTTDGYAEVRCVVSR